MALTGRLQFSLLPLTDINNRSQHETYFRRVNWAETDFDRNLAAVFASPKEVPTGAHWPGLCVAKVIVPIAHVLRPESLGNEHLDGLVDEFIALVAKKVLHAFVYKGDPPFFVNHDH